MMLNRKVNRIQTILISMIVIYVAYFSWFTILRHHTLNSNYYDLGIMDQTVYNTSRGRILDLTNPTGTETIKRMAIHNDIALALIAPFYWLYPHAETLLVLQTVVLALGALYVFGLARQFLKNSILALMIAFSYLMYPPLQWSNTYEFHAVTLATTLILAMIYHAYKKQHIISLLFFILALSTKEQVGLVCGLFGISLFINKKNSLNLRKTGIAMGVIGFVWFIISVWIIVPFFRHEDHFAVSRYKELGKSPTQIVTGIVTHPDVIVGDIANGKTLTYLNKLTSPLLYLPFLSPFSLIATPELAINILSNSANQRDIIFHYTALITPILFMGAIFGLMRINKKWHMAAAAVFVVLTLYWSYTQSPLPYSKHADMRSFHPDNNLINAVSLWENRLHDENIAVSATGTLAPHFSDRRVIIRFSQGYKSADYVVIDTQSALNDWYDYRGSIAAYASLIVDPAFRKVFDQAGLEVYERIK